jgi:XTP/dITP diphosphohydrolase
MEILLATGNRHKQEEIQRILTDHIILTPEDIGIEFEHDETGITYFDNAYGKALALHELTGRPVIADDSGLSVEAMDGAPGIYSARFGSEETGTNLSDREKYELLLKKLKNEKNRRAFFVSNMIYLTSKYRFFSCQETVEGEIAYKPEGSNGFGYDPVFYIKSLNATVAQLSATEKDAVSHRGKACRKVKEVLQNEKVNQLHSSGDNT